MKFQNPRILLLTLLLPVSAGCHFKAERETKPAPTAHVATAKPVNVDIAIQPPVTFAGMIPCADCPGINDTLTLLSGGMALQRFTYLEAENGKNLSFVELMSWRRTKGGRQLLLEGTPENTQRFAISNERTLSMLDQQGNPIKSELNYDLVRADKVDPIEDLLSLRGYYSYMANAAAFKECQTGRSFPVSQETGSVSLNRAYLNAVEKPGEPLFMTLTGRLKMRSVGGEERENLSLVPERFGQTRTHGHCP